MKNQIKLQYSVNKQLIENFNKTVQSIMHNELLLKSRILQLNQLIKENAQFKDVLFAKDLLNQLLALYNSILNTLQDIENSITFCKLGIMHPSIMKPKDLFNELQKIANHYKNQLLFDVKLENILDFENILKISCKVDFNKITYFLSLPIEHKTDFNLYYLLSTPTKVNSDFFTIIPKIKYFLRSENDEQIRPLNDKCIGSKPYHCPNTLQSTLNVSCEINLLTQQQARACRFLKLQIQEIHIEMIPELNQFLAVFPDAEKLELHCLEQTDVKEYT